jgi:hypothetical protein
VSDCSYLLAFLGFLYREYVPDYYFLKKLNNVYILSTQIILLDGRTGLAKRKGYTWLWKK